MGDIVYIGAVAVETTSILTASKVAAAAAKKNATHGTIEVGGKPYRWATIQQYEQHQGFVNGIHEGHDNIRPPVNCPVCRTTLFDGLVIKSRIVRLTATGGEAKCRCKRWVPLPIAYTPV